MTGPVTRRSCWLAVVLSLWMAASLWAGKRFIARAGVQTAPRQLIVRFKAGVSPQTVLAGAAPGARFRLLRRLRAHLVNLPAGVARDAIARRIAASPLVDYVEPNLIRRISVAPPDDPKYSRQWALTMIHALEAWRRLPNHYLTSATAGSHRIRVAVLDTGADCTHPDFINRNGSSTRAADGGQLDWSDSTALVTTEISNPACPWQDDHYHGTHVAGTIAAATNNAEGVAGAGYSIELIIFKVLDASGRGYDSTISQAIAAAADDGVAIISMSLSGPGYSQVIQDAVNYAWERNCLVVVAAGNENSSAMHYPAGANHVFGVAATDQNDQRADFSNFGNAIDIAAPGVGILSLLPSYPGTRAPQLNYGTASGTSMATPHVAAVAGMVNLTTPGLAADAVAERLQQSADSAIANGGWDQYVGYGRINALNAVTGTLRAATTGGIVGQVVDGDGVPVSNVAVSVAGSDLTTDFTGLFRFAGLPAGTYELAAARSGYPSRTMTVNVVPGADTDVVVTLTTGFGQITGTVTGATGGVAGATVQALAGGLIRATAFTGGDGNYWLAVRSGTYEIRASSVSRQTTVISGEQVVAGQTATLPITLPAFGVIVGVVEYGTHQPAAGVTVLVEGTDFSAGAVTDVDGNYSTIGLPPGAYTVSASKAGSGDAQAAGVTVATESTAVVNLVLGSTGVSVTVAPTSATLSAGQSQAFTATVAGTANQSVTWSLKPPVGSITPAGIYTAPTEVATAQTVAVRATSAADSSAFGEASVALAVSGTAGCTYTLTPTAANFAASGGTDSVTVTTASGCGWAASSNDVWITITAGASGSGPGTVNYTVAANTGASRPGTMTIAGQSFSVTQSAAASPSKVGVFREGTWFLDSNGNGQWDGPATDGLYWIGQAGDVPVVGDWNGDGTDQIGFFRNGMWLLDYNDNGQWDGPSKDRLYWIGQAGDVPLVGDWNGDGKQEIGFFRNGMWLLDYNGNGSWDGPSTDRLYWIGQTGDVPLVGDWNGDGKQEIGIFRNGMWLLDYNGNGSWDGPSTDRLYWIGQTGDVPLVGNWNGAGGDKIGIFRNGMWLLDYNGNGQWDGPLTDRLHWIGQTGDVPLVGKWNGAGGDKIGIFRNGMWLLDYNGNGAWNGPSTDRLYWIGQAGDEPIHGRW